MEVVILLVLTLGRAIPLPVIAVIATSASIIVVLARPTLLLAVPAVVLSVMWRPIIIIVCTVVVIGAVFMLLLWVSPVLVIVVIATSRCRSFLLRRTIGGH